MARAKLKMTLIWLCLLIPIFSNTKATTVVNGIADIETYS